MTFNPHDPFWSTQVKIAKQTLKMPDAMVGVMGGQTKAEAREILRIDAAQKKMTKKLKSKSPSRKVKCSDCINGGGNCKYGKNFRQYEPRECKYYMFYD
jgi:hypothetical protein